MGTKLINDPPVSYDLWGCERKEPVVESRRELDSQHSHSIPQLRRPAADFEK